ncbi:hypothetical protein WISP_92160 [Willisornis vidua]|uniref:Uncharacterized protein n=1 Tax=Willisornis vidua TaxID=1566151 RepID=A0ABQ9D777_9PASS|nr:hypothetical protein WISP_92160 [Willisornis vidua]
MHWTRCRHRGAPVGLPPSAHQNGLSHDKQKNGITHVDCSQSNDARPLCSLYLLQATPEMEYLEYSAIPLGSVAGQHREEIRA